MNRILTIVLPENAAGNLDFMGIVLGKQHGQGTSGQGTSDALVAEVQTRLKELGFDATVNVFDNPAKVPALTTIPKEYCDVLRAALQKAGLRTDATLDCELAGAIVAHLFYDTFIDHRTTAHALDDLEDQSTAIAGQLRSLK